MQTTLPNAIILCGGAGRRTRGADKPLLKYQNQPMVARILASIQPVVGKILISANRHLDEYRKYGQVVSDELEDYQGPLAGISACLKHCDSEWVLVCPGDAPNLSALVVRRLARGLLENAVDIACAHDGNRRQNLHLALFTNNAQSLRNYLDQGGRSVHGWLSTRRLVDVDCSDLEDVFLDVDSLADYRSLQR